MEFDPNHAALVFLLERNYLPGLMVLIQSMRETRSFDGIPIVVVSNDAEVIDHPFVKTVATQRHFLGPDALARYRDLPRTNVPERHQLPYAPKYTWLKFLLYRDFGYRSNIYMDTDMLVVRNTDSVLHELTKLEFDVAATFTIGRHHLEDLDDPVLFVRQWQKMSTRRPEYSVERFSVRPVGFNSGFLVANRRVLGSAYIDKLFEIAARDETGYEQRMNYHALMELDARFCFLPVWINLTRPVYDKAIAFGLGDLVERTMIHHYILAKPWTKPRAKMLPSDLAWLDVAQRMRDSGVNVQAAAFKELC